MQLYPPWHLEALSGISITSWQMGNLSSWQQFLILCCFGATPSPVCRHACGWTEYATHVNHREKPPVKTASTYQWLTLAVTHQSRSQVFPHFWQGGRGGGDHDTWFPSDTSSSFSSSPSVSTSLCQLCLSPVENVKLVLVPKRVVGRGVRMVTGPPTCLRCARRHLTHTHTHLQWSTQGPRTHSCQSQCNVLSAHCHNAHPPWIFTATVTVKIHFFYSFLCYLPFILLHSQGAHASLPNTKHLLCHPIFNISFMTALNQDLQSFLKKKKKNDTERILLKSLYFFLPIIGIIFSLHQPSCIEQFKRSLVLFSLLGREKDHCFFLKRLTLDHEKQISPCAVQLHWPS